GIVQGGTVTAAGAAHLTLKSAPGGALLEPSGALSGVTLKTDLLVEQGAILTVGEGLELDANLTVQGGGGASFCGSGRRLQGTQTVVGTGQIILGSKAPASVGLETNGDGTPAVVTLAPGVTLHGQGTIGNASFDTGQVVNQGLIAVDAAQTLAINADLSNP